MDSILHSSTFSMGLKILIFWMIFRFLRKLYRSSKKGKLLKTPFAQAVAVGRPYFAALTVTDFSLMNPSASLREDDYLTSLRTPILHYLGLPPRTDDEALQVFLSTQFKNRWFTYDLQSLKSEDDPMAAIAFACARTAFITRVLMLKEWLPHETGIWILALNLQRTQDCFDSWQSYGDAYIAGRQQWGRNMKMDPFLNTIPKDAPKSWFTKGETSWHLYEWEKFPGFTTEHEKWCPH